MLISGKAILRLIDQVAASNTVIVPGFVLPAVSSNWVSTQTSPTPGVAGLNNSANSIS